MVQMHDVCTVARRLLRLFKSLFRQTWSILLITYIVAAIFTICARIDLSHDHLTIYWWPAGILHSYIGFAIGVVWPFRIGGWINRIQFWSLFVYLITIDDTFRVAWWYLRRSKYYENWDVDTFSKFDDDLFIALWALFNDLNSYLFVPFFVYMLYQYNKIQKRKKWKNKHKDTMEIISNNNGKEGNCNKNQNKNKNTSLKQPLLNDNDNDRSEMEASSSTSIVSLSKENSKNTQNKKKYQLRKSMTKIKRQVSNYVENRKNVNFDRYIIHKNEEYTSTDTNTNTNTKTKTKSNSNTDYTTQTSSLLSEIEDGHGYYRQLYASKTMENNINDNDNNNNINNNNHKRNLTMASGITAATAVTTPTLDADVNYSSYRNATRLFKVGIILTCIWFIVQDTYEYFIFSKGLDYFIRIPSLFLCFGSVVYDLHVANKEISNEKNSNLISQDNSQNKIVNGQVIADYTKRWYKVHFHSFWYCFGYILITVFLVDWIDATIDIIEYFNIWLEDSSNVIVYHSGRFLCFLAYTVSFRAIEWIAHRFSQHAKRPDKQMNVQWDDFHSFDLQFIYMMYVL